MLPASELINLINGSATPLKLPERSREMVTNIKDKSSKFAREERGGEGRGLSRNSSLRINRGPVSLEEVSIKADVHSRNRVALFEKERPNDSFFHQFEEKNN